MKLLSLEQFFPEIQICFLQELKKRNPLVYANNDFEHWYTLGKIFFSNSIEETNGHIIITSSLNEFPKILLNIFQSQNENLNFNTNLKKFFETYYNSKNIIKKLPQNIKNSIISYLDPKNASLERLIKSPFAGPSNGGFSWMQSFEGHSFWSNIIEFENYSTYMLERGPFTLDNMELPNVKEVTLKPLKESQLIIL